jgi:periplasmic protein TonB
VHNPVKITIVQKISRLFEALTGEINHRPIVGLLTLLVLLLHLWAVVLLLQPPEKDNVIEPLKVMEVALLSEPSPKVAPLAPSTPAPPKKVPPKKKVVKPPVKKKEPVVHNQGEIPKPKPVSEEQTPAQPSPSESVQKPEALSSGAQSTVSKPITKTGNDEAYAKGVNSGIVELGCPKPKYPMRAMSRHIEGWVKIDVIINTTGAVTNAKVVGAQPPGIFDDVALDATEKCKFKPKIVNGIAVIQRGSKVSRFKLTN